MFENPFPTVFILKGNKLGLEKSRELPKDSCVPATDTVKKSFQMGREKVKRLFIKVICRPFQHSAFFSGMFSTLPKRAQPGH